VKIPVEPLEPISAAWAQRCPRKALFDRQVEDQRQIGSEIANRKPLQHGQIAQRNAAAIALIRQGRVVEAIANHPATRIESRPDEPGDMLAPRRVKQQRLASGIPAFGVALDEKLPKRFGARRATGLTRCLRGNSSAL